MRLRTTFAVSNLRFRSRSVGRERLPVVGWCSIHVEDGRALIFPESGGCIVVDWFRWCEFLRRRERVTCCDMCQEPIRLAGTLRGLCSKCCRCLGGGAHSARAVQAEAAAMGKRGPCK